MQIGHVIGREEVKKYINHDIFIETGTFKGAGISTARSYNFKEYYSCEISKTIFDNLKFVEPNIHIYNLNSLDFLEKILPDINDTTVFWLDAHYPYQYDTNLSDSETTFYPLLKELEIIKKLKRNVEKDIILCDDIRVIQSEDNPTKKGPGQNAVNEYHLVTDMQLKDLINIFDETHIHKTIGDCLVFIPRNS